MITEEMILSNKKERERLIQRVDILEKVKELLLIPGTEFATIIEIADFYEVSVETIQKIYQRNKDEIDMDGIQLTTANELIGHSCPISKSIYKTQFKTIICYENGRVVEMSNRGVKVFPKRAILRIGMLLRNSKVAKEVRTQLLNIEEKVAIKIKEAFINEEKRLLENIELAYKAGNIDGLMNTMSVYKEFQSRYIRELESKIKENNKNINQDLLVTVCISERIKNKGMPKAWKKEVKKNELGESTILVLKFVHDFINDNGYSPTIREICDAIGLKSTSSVHTHLTKLETLGYLIKDYKKTRNIRINESKYSVVIK